MAIDPQDIVGKKFGRLTVLEAVANKRFPDRGSARYLCRCECGNEKIVRRADLLCGHVKSCGCGRRIDPFDIVGKQFNEWTVLCYLGKKNKEHRYKCQCSCGEIRELGRRNLVSGRTKSCGHEVDVWEDPAYQLPYPDDIIGEKMHDLTCIKRLGKNRDNNWIYLCRCSCGNEIKVERGNFMLGLFRNCGRCHGEKK